MQFNFVYSQISLLEILFVVKLDFYWFEKWHEYNLYFAF